MMKNKKIFKRNLMKGYIVNSLIILLLLAYFIFGVYWFTKNDVAEDIEQVQIETLELVEIKLEETLAKKETKLEPISDFGKLNSSASNYYEVKPKTISEAQKIIHNAYESNTPLRFRGSGHNAAGMTLPNVQELLISTYHLSHYKLEEKGTVTIGAGVTMWAVRDFVQSLGYYLPVFPDDQGPTLGGYISVGGIGVGSAKYGGFWENVISVTLVTGKGELKIIESSDELFPWVFGSNGQLGLVVEAKLKIVSIDKKTIEYELNKTGDVFFENRRRHITKNDSIAPENNQRFFFQYLFVPISQREEAFQNIQDLMSSYSYGFSYFPVDELLIKHKSITAPLIFQYPEDAVALGIRATALLSNEEDRQRLVRYGDDFRKLAVEKGYKIYLQHDSRFHDTDYRTYYGNTVYDQFLLYKKRFDPKNILNPGSVFP